MKKINPIEHSDKILHALGHGGMFLNSKLGDEINTMTIGWGSMSIYWGKAAIIVPVRQTRHTHHMIDESGVFTVSIPLEGRLRKELGICGTKSGRDTDKFTECGFTAKDGQIIDCPIIGEANIHLECKVVSKILLDEKALYSDILEKHYGSKDFHTLFFGEIVDAYILD